MRADQVEGSMESNNAHIRSLAKPSSCDFPNYAPDSWGRKMQKLY
jgi:hypothetical protein